MTLFSPQNRSGTNLDFPSFPFSSKPGSCPEAQDSPIISGRQKFFYRKRGSGVLHRTSRDLRVALFVQFFLGFSALCSQLVKQAGLQILYRWNERPGPRDLAQINLADLKLLHIILALPKHRTVRGYDPASTPELQTLLYTNPVNISEIDGVLHRPAQTEPLEKPPPQTRTCADTDN